jgi:hypothetical protein
MAGNREEKRVTRELREVRTSLARLKKRHRKATSALKHESQAYRNEINACEVRINMREQKIAELVAIEERNG